MLFPSDLVAEALKLKPDAGLPAWQQGPTHCSHCARPIEAGDLYSTYKAGEFFGDTRDLAAYSGIVCWRCVHLRKKPFMDSLLFRLVTRTEIYPIATNVAKAWLFMTPPEGPFVITHSSTGQTQHLAWRTPVTLDNRLLTLRYGPTLYTIRPEAIRRVADMARRMNDGQTAWINPILFDRKGADPAHGLVNPKALPLLLEGEREFLMGLSPGERWGLASVVHSKMPVPEMPEPITQELIAKLASR